MNNARLSELFKKYYNGEASESETDELMLLLKKLPGDELSSLLLQQWNEQNENQNFFISGLRDKLLEKIHYEDPFDAEVQRIGLLKKKILLRVAAAAAVILVLSVSAFFLFQGKDQVIALDPNTKPAIPVASQIEPGGDKAILTLADGSQIVLDTASNGNIVEQGGIQVIKSGGQLTYNTESSSTQVFYNTITIPRGGQYQLELADGTKVWLNSSSSIKFPTAFVGKERSVELTGEGYFEVAHDPKMPFIVKVNNIDVTVLGTHFNINSYSDEPSIKTTLLEGRVKLQKNKEIIFLNPGQQAIANDEKDEIKVKNEVDTEEVVAWKNGRFFFTSAGLESILRQAARWYDVEIDYKTKLDQTFSGGLPRSENITELLKILEATGKVEFEINGRQVIVKSKP
jgi:transmembrane sensor